MNFVIGLTGTKCGQRFTGLTRGCKHFLRRENYAQTGVQMREAVGLFGLCKRQSSVRSDSCAVKSGPAGSLKCRQKAGENDRW